ncbi:MAG TPA: PQQ-binding-like beta-propeller repeat protein [Gemmatimonadales bacterium]|nr:PQQ-binding-like beta-propeller repeat protein [Gemmatimonadales bacterium]
MVQALRHSAVFVLSAAALPCAAQAPPVWVYTAPSSVNYLYLTPLATLVVATDDALIGLDSTGAVAWTRPTKERLQRTDFESIPGTRLGVMWRATGFDVFDLQTGVTRWNSDSLDLGGGPDYLAVPEGGFMLVYGRPRRGPPALAAVDLDSGTRRWTLDRPFDVVPVHFDWTNYAWDSDTTFILYLSDDGPLRVDARSGHVLWSADSLRGKTAPYLTDGYPPILVDSGVAYVAVERRLEAIRTADGTLLWRHPPKVDGDPRQVARVPEGLLVRSGNPLRVNGAAFGSVELLDAATGERRWAKPYGADGGMTPLFVRDGRAYFATGKALVSLELSDGTPTDLAPVAFRGHEHPWLVEPRGADYLLLGGQNLMLVDEHGAERYHVFHAAPSPSTLAKVATVVAVVAIAAAEVASRPAYYYPAGPGLPIGPKTHTRAAENPDFVYQLATLADSTGHSRPCYLKLNKNSGSVEGAACFGDKNPEMRIDQRGGVLFVKTGDKTVSAFRP